MTTEEHEHQLRFERLDGWLSGFIWGTLFSAAVSLLILIVYVLANAR